MSSDRSADVAPPPRMPGLAFIVALAAILALAILVAGCADKAPFAPTDALTGGDGATAADLASIEDLAQLLDAGDDAGATTLHCAPLPRWTPPLLGDGGVLSGINPAHPRLEILAGDLPALRARVATDPLAQQWYASLLATWSDAAEHDPAPTYHLTEESTKATRAIMDRLTNLSGLYLLSATPEEPAIAKLRDRVRADLDAVAAFPDWYHCDKMLSVAEMAFGVAIAYDWLYDQLSDGERASIAAALVHNALVPAVRDYAGLPDPACKDKTLDGWVRFHGNQAEVCNGGVLAAALAIAGPDDPASSDTTGAIAKAVAGAPAHVKIALPSYSRDGAWHEGPNYWDYGTRYLAHLITMGLSALGTDFGIPATEGLARTGDWRSASAGPTGETFNFADVGAVVSLGNQESFWLARQYDQPRDEVDAVRRAQHPASDNGYATAPHGMWDTGGNLDVFDLVRYDPGCAGAIVPDLPLGQVFRGTEAATMRTSWSDPNAIYLAMKAGDDGASHVHLDAGGFVFDVGGERWGIDLGDDAYSLPNYFGDRGSYYRTRTEGHNTLSISASYPQQRLYFANQDRASSTQLVAFQSTPALSFAVADLGAAYTPKVTGIGATATPLSFLRGVAIVDGKQILVDDELSAPQTVEAVWSFHTRATPTAGASADTVVLTQNGKTLQLRALEPAGAAFTISPADPTPRHQTQPPDPLESTNGWNEATVPPSCTAHDGRPQCVYNVFLRVVVPAGVPTRIAVRFAEDAATPPPTLQPLSTWVAAAPIAR